ncbi:hypothetical protein TSUD_374520 [Trifolium subterraneum]|uniref:Retrotransposon gag domain-containing protein n=1 Tax=Trifolium subterraneum TaxID=3900 RepID=A0A2Z6P672_TRISU|nr:hypothetical protein TSUD_374520 [Trifolium subterraneum]
MTPGSRGDDYQYRRENSPRREETPTHSPGWSDDEVYKGPLSRQIMDLELPCALQKPPQLGKIFPTTLVEGAMAWYTCLPHGSITSWKDLCKQFTSHFTSSRKHPKTEANLEAVRQGPDETLRSYIERFNKEVVQVDVTDDMKKYLMRKNLCDGTKFKEMVANEKPATWDEILYKAQAYMQFEEETMTDAIRYSRIEDNRPPRDYGHLTEDCIQLKDAIESLIRNGKLKDYVKWKENPRQEKKREDTLEDEPKSSGEMKVAMAIWRPEYFYVPNYLKDTYEPPILNEWEKFPEAMVISGGVFDKHTIGSVKREFEELITTSSGMVVTLGKPKTSSQPLSFYLEDLPEGSANSQIPLLVRAEMTNFDVQRILVDSGSSCDIMYAHLFRTLQLDESHLTPYLGSDLQGFNGETTKPWGYVDLIVTFGHNETATSIKVKFLVVECQFLYQCLIGRTAIADLPAIASTAHLKMKYYTNKRQSYIGPVLEAKKSKTSSEQAETNTKPPPQQPPQNVSLVDLDSRHSKQEHKEEKNLRKEKKEGDTARKENLRPIPDGDFVLILLGEDPSRNLKIGKDVPDLARKQQVACLKDNADLFAWSASEMPGLDPDIVCHQLTVDEAASAVVQRRRRESPEKMEAAEKALSYLILGLAQVSSQVDIIFLLALQVGHSVPELHNLGLELFIPLHELFHLPARPPLIQHHSCLCQPESGSQILGKLGNQLLGTVLQDELFLRAYHRLRVLLHVIPHTIDRGEHESFFLHDSVEVKHEIVSLSLRGRRLHHRRTPLDSDRRGRTAGVVWLEEMTWETAVQAGFFFVTIFLSATILTSSSAKSAILSARTYKRAERKLAIPNKESLASLLVHSSSDLVFTKQGSTLGFPNASFAGTPAFVINFTGWKPAT